MNQSTEVVFSESEQFSKVLVGAKKLFEAVKTTMGPSGNTVIIEQGYDKFPTITKDGVTVARSIHLKPKLEAIGASLIKEVASKTNEVAGDGTTTATVFAYTLLEDGYKKLAMGASALELKRGMESALEDTKVILHGLTTKITTHNESVNVATISANGDKELGALIADAVHQVGLDGIVTVESSKNFQTTLSLTNGMLVDNGYINPYFVTNSEKSHAVLDKPLVFIANQKLSLISEFVHLLEHAVSTKTPILIICEDVEGEALNTLVSNKARKTLDVCVIKAPSYGEHRIELLEDLAEATGTKVFGGHSGTTLKKVTPRELGRLAKATVNRNNSIFLPDASPETTERVAGLTKKLQDILANGDLDSQQAERVRNRLAKVTGNIAVIKVGGSTEADVGERKDRIDDALNATLAAARQGVVAGGGFALLRVAQKLKEQLPTIAYGLSSQDGFVLGYQAFIKACESPFRTIIENAGYPTEFLFHDAMQKLKNETEEDKQFGFNARTGQWCNLFDEGIQDPVLVTLSAVSYACSVISLAISCKAIIVDGDEE